MKQRSHSYRIRIYNMEDVLVEKSDSTGNVVEERRGHLTYGDRIKSQILDLHQAARVGELTGLDVQKLGEDLFAVLFDEELSSHFFSTYEQIISEDSLLHLELDIDETVLPDVAALPWEFMRTPTRTPYPVLWLGTAAHLTLTRRRLAWGPLANRGPSPNDKLRIAIAVASPRDRNPAQYTRIWNKLRELADKHPTRIHLLDLVNPATPLSIDLLLRQVPHIFHFIGHARLHNDLDQESGQIALVDSLNNTDWIEAEQFAALLSRYRPQVVLLQACEGAALSRTADFVGIAPVVIKQNIPSVVAMQYEISNISAQRFFIEFYERLALGIGIDRAVQEGRLSIALARGSSGYTTIDFATPVLFMRTSNSNILPARPVGLSDQLEASTGYESFRDSVLLDLYHRYKGSHIKEIGLLIRELQNRGLNPEINNL